MSPQELLLLILSAIKWVILAHVIMSWLINFQVLNLRQPLVWKAWTTLNNLLEPIYSQVRRVIPSFSGVDFAPLVVLIGIILLENVVVRGF